MQMRGNPIEILVNNDSEQVPRLFTDSKFKNVEFDAYFWNYDGLLAQEKSCLF